LREKMKKPLFDVHLKIWENWGHFWSTVPWFLKKMSQGEFDNIGKTRHVAGAYNPTSNEVHLYMDEIAQSVIARLEKKGMFTADNYQIELVKEIFGTLVHELVHSLPVFKDANSNERHNVDLKKLGALQDQSLWYFELVKLCHSLEQKLFDIKDSNKGFGTEEDFPA
jgi:hypothetical protein